MGEKMNNIMDMLNGVEVEWKALGGVAKNLDSMRKPITSGLRESGDIPYYGASGIVDYVKDYIFDGDYLLVSEDGANLLARNTPIAFSISGKSWVNNHAHVLKFNTYAERRFVEIFLNSIDLTPYISGAAQPKLNQQNLNTIQIPIPPLNIQTEIVRILDAFTALTAELTAELTARKKQYNYYRDKLLTFEDEVPVVQLSHCCVSIADGDHQAPPKTDMGIPFITISNVSDAKQIDFINTRFVSEAYYDELDNKRKARKNDILYTVVGSLGIPIFIDNDRKFAFQRHIAILRPNGNVIIPKYLYHVLRSSDFLKQAYAVAVGAAQKTITLTALNRMQIPMPPLAEQARIVAILDKFDALTNSITEGLPREIELRQQQYAYYRDLLLSFPKAVTETPLESVEEKHG